ncbi:dihydroneopterin aldolase [Haematomicrobium sanguinis]|uniref:dihydroneopterin aldolase n=1 Tax=Haematomicrobium sanguinis TaxID=479106 RepID=UPI000A8E580A
MSLDAGPVAGGAGDVAAGGGVDGLDQVTVTGVTAVGFHGVLDNERREGQPFIADVTLFLDTRAAAAGDDLTKTANYAEVAELIREEIATEPVNLIETLAERTAARILAEFEVAAIRLTIHKPKAPIPVPFNDVTVSIFRTA